MNLGRIVWTLISSSAICILVANVSADTGPLEKLKARQKGIRTVESDFRQEKHTQLLVRPIRSSGKVYMKSGVGVRWEYKGEMVVIYDGEDVYLHYTELDEADRIKGAGGYAGPLTFDIVELLRDYQVEAAESGGEIILDLKPLKRMPFASMKMVFGEGAAFPGKVVIIEEDGDRTVIRFREVEQNVDIPDRMFEFTPPPGVVLRERAVSR